MTVSVNQPPRGESDLDQIAKAVSIASTLFGVKMNNDQRKAAEELAKAKQMDAETRLAEQTRIDAGKSLSGKVAVNERPKDGDFIPRDLLPQQAQLSLPQDAIGVTSVKSSNPYQALQADMAMTRLQMAQASEQRTIDKIKNDGVKRLSEKLDKSGIGLLW